MSRFLRHMVERARGLGERLERRRPALFESRRPPSPAEDGLAIDDEISTGARTPSLPLSTHAAMATAPEAASVAVPAESPLPASGSMTTPPPPCALPPPPSVSLTIPPPAPIAARPHEPPATLRIEAAPTITNHARRPAEAVPSPRIPPSSRAAVAPPAASPMPMHEVTPSPRSERLREPRRTEPNSRRDTSRTELPPPARLPARAEIAGTVAHPARRASVANTLAAAPPAPVQVSIGRVEIRAATAPPPARTRDPSRSPALTLDDYLRRRHGDRR